MAFEVFDDIGFFFLAFSLLIIFVVPPTLYYVYIFLNSLLKAKPPHSREAAIAGTCQCPKCDSRRHHKKEGKIFTTSRILLLLGWVLLIYCFVQIPRYQGEQLATFNPHAILGIDVGADEAEIKAAYKKLVLKYHPDKNPTTGNAEKFILITRAKDALTDETAKKNMEMFGNPDGKRELSVTIGLPSFLTRRENEKKVLVVYFLVIILLPPILVGYWYTNSKQYHDSGVMLESLARFFHLIKPEMAIPMLVDVLSQSGEFRRLDRMQCNPQEYTNLELQVEGKVNKAKPGKKMKAPWVTRAYLLLLAHMKRIPLTAGLQRDLTVILKFVPTLLDQMIDLVISRRWLKPAMEAISLSQLITQGMWIGDSPLLQLPHLDITTIRKAHKHCATIQQLRDCPPDKRQKLFGHLTEDQQTDLDAVVKVLPNIRLDCKYEVEDEQGIRADDVVTFTITLKRLKPGEVGGALAESEGITEFVSPTPTDDDDEKKKKEKEEEDETEKEKEKEKEKEDKDKPKKKTKKRAVYDPEFEKRLDDLPVTPHKIVTQTKAGHSPLVHSAYFPYPKKEKWIVILLEKTPKGSFLVGLHKIADLIDSEEVKLPLRLDKAGDHTYELHVRNDSYVGCDLLKIITVHAEKAVKNEEKKVEVVDDEEDAEEKAEPKWYYLGYSSFVEFLMNMAALAVLLGFAYKYLDDRGYWKAYVQPLTDKLYRLVAPVFRIVYSFISPAVDPVINTLNSVALWLVQSNARTINATRGAEL